MVDHAIAHVIRSNEIHALCNVWLEKKTMTKIDRLGEEWNDMEEKGVSVI